MTIKERFFKKVNKTDTCWLWTAANRAGGYGCIKVNSKTVDAHRVSWQIHNGEIPEGMLVCHKCDVRLCVKPGHLFLGTARDNAIDAIKKGRLFDLKNSIPSHGEHHKDSKLTQKQVAEILIKHIPFQYSTRKLAREYKVNQSTIMAILKRRTWKHVKMET